MSRRFVCPRGHQWEAAAVAHSLAAHLDPLCPVCGAAAVQSEGEAGGLAPPEIVEHIPRPATAEPAVSRVSFAQAAAAPAPLPPATPARQEQPVAAVLRSPETPPEPRPRRHPLAIGLGVVGGLLLIACAVLAWVSHRDAVRARQEADEQRRLAEQNAQEATRQRGEAGAARKQVEQVTTKWTHARTEAENQREEADRLRQELETQKTSAEQALKEARQQYAQEAAARTEAREQSQQAEAARTIAQKQRDEMAGRLVQLYAAGGTRRMESGDLLAALPWLAEALRLGQGDARRETVNRLRWAATLAQCPRPVQAWFHTRQYQDAQLSPNGRRLATAGRDGTARLWIVSTGEAVGEVMKHDAPVALLRYGPDGQQLLTLAEDGIVRLWEAATGKGLRALNYDGLATDAVWSPDGRRILTLGQSAEGDEEVRVWDAATGEAGGKPLRHNRDVNHAAFRPDGRQVVTACADRTARLWDYEKGEQVGPALEHQGAVNQAEFSPDGRRVLTASADGTARVWDAASGRPITPPLKHGQAVTLASFRPDGQQLLTASADGTVRLWDAATGEPGEQPLRHGDALKEAAFSPDGRYLLTAGGNAPVRLWDALTGAPVGPPLPASGAVQLAAFSNDGRRVMVFGSQAFILWDLSAAEPPAPPAREATSNERAWASPDGRLVLRATGPAAQLYDASRNQAIGPSLKHRFDVVLAAFSADGKRLVTVCQKGQGDAATADVQLWEAATGKQIGEGVELLTAVSDVRFSPDGKYGLTVGADRTVRVWDAATLKPVGKAIDHKEPVTHAVFSPDGQQLLTATQDGTARLWASATRAAVGQPLKHRGALSHVAFSSDGKQVLTASLDTTAAVWEAATGRPITATYMKHDGPIAHAAFSPDGGRMLTASADRTARVWDARSGKPLTPPLKHDGPVTLGAFSPDGRWTATVSGHVVRVWDAASGEAVSPPLKHTPGRALTYLSFDPAGRLVTGETADPQTRRTWDLVPDGRPVAELLALAQLLAGVKLDATGSEVVCDAEELRTAWRDLPKKHPRDFSAPSERALAWHRRGAEECERQQLWHGARLHLDQLIENGPNAELYVRRGRAWAGTGRWDRAAADYQKALELQPERRDLLLLIGRAYGEQGQWDRAAAAYTRALEARKNDRDLLVLRARAFAEQEKWNEAAADFSRAMDRGTSSADVWRQHALVRLAAGDADGYRKLCARLVRRHGDSTDAAVVRTVAWTCALSADAGVDLQPLLQWAESAAAAQPNSRPFLQTLAALLYRSGQFEAAVRRFEAAQKLPGEDGRLHELLFLALAHQRLGHADEAKKRLEQAVREMEKPPRPLPWEQRLELTLLRREAQQLLGGKPPAP
jgi:WD40 repeat protein/predicted Zn-dependent protease